MKLRILEKGITLRLKDEEIVLLQDNNKLEQTTSLPNSEINIVVEVKNIDNVQLNHSTNLFDFSFPETNLDDWNDKHRIGFTNETEGIIITIERDLPSRRKSREVTGS